MKLVVLKVEQELFKGGICLEKSLEEIRSNALSFDRSQIIQVYFKSSGINQEYFIELIREARLSFINGCPRASITLSGEALISVLMFKLRQLHEDGKVSLREDDIKKVLSDDPEQTLKFREVISILYKNKLFDSKITRLMNVVRLFRNRATHGHSVPQQFEQKLTSF